SSEEPLPEQGGMARLVSILQDGLRGKGHHVDVFYPTIRLKELKFSRIPLADYRNYDLIHVHGPTPLLSDTALIKQRRPIVYTHHAEVSWISEIISKLYRRVHRYIVMIRAKAIIVHSRDYARLFDDGKNTFIIRPCTIPPPNEFVTPDEKDQIFTVLFVGQLRPFKGVEMLIRSAKMLKDIRFIIIGEGYLKPKLMKMARDVKNVEFLGRVSDRELVDCYRLSHVICLPSINTTEGWGLVLTEGAFHGCVPVASNLIGVREHVNIIGGLLVNPNSVQDLTNRLSSIKREGSFASLMAKVQRRSRLYYRENDEDSYVRGHESVYKLALGRIT
ncbi:MAG: glycosyltransferase family 4 protein, partial [Candidatus Bathyarchaeia archaeon]